MAAGRTLHVRCTTWEQVEQFYARKLRRGKLLSMKVPFTAALGSAVTLGLELPNDVVIAIDGTVKKASPIEGDTKTWIEVELVGFTDEVIGRIKAMAAGVTAVPASAAPDAPPERPSKSTLATDELPVDERQLFQHLTAELKRMRQVAVHEVLGVERDAEPEQIRRAWMALVRRLHPDLVARRKAPAISHLAEELTILANRAYDRLRAALVAEGRANVLGSVVKPPPGWLVGFDDLASGAGSDPARRKSEKMPALEKPESAPNSVAAQGSGGQGAGGQGETFEARARTHLGQGDADTAQEVLAAALVVYPRSKPLRSLYYVASAVSALGKGEVVLATSQLETALAHYAGCTEAQLLLDHVKKHGPEQREAMLRVFQ